MGKAWRCGPQLPVPPICPLPSPWQQVGTSWEQSEALYNLVKEVLLDVLATDPQALPQPPAVVDGVPAAPGVVGEIWTASAQGNWGSGGSTTVAPGANFVVPNLPLPAGDWDVSWQMTIYNAAGGNAGVSAALVRLGSPVPPQATNNMAGFVVNIPNMFAPAGDPTQIQPMILTGPTVPFVSAVQLGLVFNLFVWPSGAFPSGPYQFNTWARRRR